VWTALWIYLLAPPLGMVFAALVNRQAHLPRIHCAKLLHDPGVRCIHCEYDPKTPDTLAQQGGNSCGTTVTT
jgi:hypothetical protein